MKHFKPDFSDGQWGRIDEHRFCRTCEKTLSNNGEKRECSHCQQWQAESAFSPEAWRSRDHKKRVCNECGEKRLCRGCKEFKIRRDFSDGEWKHAGWPMSEQGRCLLCARRNQDVKWCSMCKDSYPQEKHFSKKMWEKIGDAKRKCLQCCMNYKNKEDVTPKVCSVCGESFTKVYFSDWQWKLSDRVRQCISCCSGPNSPNRHGQWKCLNCKRILQKDLFRMWMQDKKVSRCTGKQKCNKCWLEEKAVEDEVARSNQKHIVRK